MSTVNNKDIKYCNRSGTFIEKAPVGQPLQSFSIFHATTNFSAVVSRLRSIPSIH
jgi:hypothetical protein